MSARWLPAGDHGWEQHGGVAEGRGLPCTPGRACFQQTPPVRAQGALRQDCPWGAQAAVGLGSACVGLLGSRMEVGGQEERQGCEQEGI